jgi:ribosome-associated toxin RatA of RatAB toxin-antitoxin module
MGMLKELSGQATRPVRLPAAECFAVLADVDGYPEWYPDVVHEVDVLEREPDGQARRARTKLHLSWGPVVKDFDLVLGIDARPVTMVNLARVSDAPSANTFEATWRLHETGMTEIAIELRAALDVPRFMPLGGIGDAIAGGFVDAAVRRLAGA